jgi:CYTH domain-containing protein
MGTEIERKFLVKGREWSSLAEGIHYLQGYLCTDKNRTVRVRTAGDKGYITIKGPGDGLVRPEYEYEIPCRDAAEMIEKLCEKPVIDKKRYSIPFGSHIWEVDEFFDDNEGLVIAEVELEDPTEEVKLPAWIGAEVTGDRRYYNAHLVKNPYRLWKDQAAQRE